MTRVSHPLEKTSHRVFQGSLIDVLELGQKTLSQNFRLSYPSGSVNGWLKRTARRLTLA